MAGPNMEVFKFGVYMFFPVLIMYKFGDPEWYETYVKPYGEIIWPPYESTYKPPRTSPELHSELERLRSERLARQARLGGADDLDHASGPIVGEHTLAKAEQALPPLGSAQRPLLPPPPSPAVGEGASRVAVEVDRARRPEPPSATQAQWAWATGDRRWV